MVQFSSVAQSCLTPCDPMDCSTPGFPVHHQSSKPTQTHVHRVGDAIQPSHPLSSPSPPTLNLSQHQGLFQWVSSSHQVAKLLEFQLQHQSFQRIFRTDFFSCTPGPCYDNRTSVKSVCHTQTDLNPLNPCQYLPKSIFLILAFWMDMNCCILVFLIYISLICGNMLTIFLWAYLPLVHLF